MQKLLNLNQGLQKKKKKFLPFTDKCIKNGIHISWGGADINPKIYGHNNVGSYISEYSKQTDAIEIAEYNAAVSKGIPVVGICRGHQLASALNGLTLIQDQYHPSNHYITTRNLKNNKFSSSCLSNSCHHQSVYTGDKLEGDNFVVLAYTETLSDNHKYDGDIPKPKFEVEMIYFPKTNTLGIQGHPEWTEDTDEYWEFNNYINNCIDELLLNKNNVYKTGVQPVKRKKVKKIKTTNL